MLNKILKIKNKNFGIRFADYYLIVAKQHNNFTF